VTTVRDLGDRRYLSLSLRQRPRVSGAAAHPGGGPADHGLWGALLFPGRGGRGRGRFAAAVRERAERGCDVVKVMVIPGKPDRRQRAAPIPVRPGRPAGHRRLGPPCGTACRRVRPRDPGRRRCCRGRFDTLEHVTFFTADGVSADPALLEQIAASGVVVSVTASTIPGSHAPHPAIAPRMAAIAANHSRVFRAGATMIPGTDAGVSPGKPHDVLPYALQVLVDRIGMTAAQAGLLACDESMSEPRLYQMMAFPGGQGVRASW
jgi:hypothetical protein